MYKSERRYTFEIST